MIYKHNIWEIGENEEKKEYTTKKVDDRWIKQHEQQTMH